MIKTFTKKVHNFSISLSVFRLAHLIWEGPKQCFVVSIVFIIIEGGLLSSSLYFREECMNAILKNGVANIKCLPHQAFTAPKQTFYNLFKGNSVTI